MHLSPISPLLPLVALLLSFLFWTTHATTTIHYYKISSCNTGTDVGSYDAPLNETASDSACHSITTAATKAMYINGLDDGCAVIAYTTDNCAPSSASSKLGIKGQCFYLESMGVIAAWRSVCGTGLAAASASLGGGAATTATATMTGTGAGNATASVRVSGTASASASANAAVRIDGFVGGCGSAFVMAVAMFGAFLVGGNVLVLGA